MKRVTPEMEAEILRLFHAEHFKIGTISAALQLHHYAVRRVLGMLGPRALRPKLPKPSNLAGYEDFIRQTLERYPRLRATRLHDMLRERGYSGSPRQLRRYVTAVRPEPARKPAFLQIETLPGEQAQVDWAHAGRIHVPGGVRDLWLFVLVLSHSRAMFAEFVVDLTVYSLLRSLVRASECLGGCPRVWLFDNPKTVVLQRAGDAAQFHPLLLELCGQMRVQPKLCEVRSPHHKGKVERAIRYLRDRFLDGRAISSVAKGNAQLATFINEIAHPRVHPTFKDRTVIQVFSDEQPRLLALPAQTPVTDQVVACTVDSHAFVHFDTNRYSVPSRYAGRRDVSICADDQVVRVVVDGETCALHTRSFARNQKYELNEHRSELVKQRSRARVAKQHDRLREAAPAIQQLFEAWLRDGINVGFATIRVAQLLDLYGTDVFRRAVEETLSRGSHDVGALALRCEVQRRALGKPVTTSVQFGSHVDDKPVRQHSLEDYDD